MRLNKYIAAHTNFSRREADELIVKGRVHVNGSPANLGYRVRNSDAITVNGELVAEVEKRYVLMDKPVGYVCSRNGQGSPTIYELLKQRFHNLNTVGRLDRDSSGLLLLTNDGDVAHQLTHPTQGKEKIYHVSLNRALGPSHLAVLQEGIELDDGLSQLSVQPIEQQYEVRMTEGRNRQIRRTFQALGYQVISLRRIVFGPFSIDDLQGKSIRDITDEIHQYII
jgi:23S rRNA pseudouridine2605 synthase